MLETTVGNSSINVLLSFVRKFCRNVNIGTSVYAATGALLICDVIFLLTFVRV